MTQDLNKVDKSGDARAERRTGLRTRGHDGAKGGSKKNCRRPDPASGAQERMYEEPAAYRVQCVSACLRDEMGSEGLSRGQQVLASMCLFGDVLARCLINAAEQ